MRVLLCGGSHADIPQIEALRQLGHWVATSGNNPNELGHRFADAYLPGDYSDAAAMQRIVEEHGIDRVVPCCNDFSYVSCATVATSIGQRGYDTPAIARQLHDKDAFRALCSTLSIPVPRVMATCDAAGDLPRQFDIPVIVKPVDLSGGKGMSKVAAGEDARSAIRHAIERSKAGRVVIEEYVEGSNHGLSTIIADGKVVFSFADNEHYFVNPYLVAGASTPGSARSAVIAGLIRDIETLAAGLTLVDGLMHCQFIQTADGYRLLEICRRPPGDLYTRFVEMATGVPYPSLLVRQFLGEAVAANELAPSARPLTLTRHCAMAHRNGTFRRLDIDPRLEGMVAGRFDLLRPGDEIRDFQTQKAAILFIDRTGRDWLADSDVAARVSVIVD